MDRIRISQIKYFYLSYVHLVFTAPVPAHKWEPPTFETNLKPLKVTEGGETKLVLKVKGVPVPVVQWFKDEVPVSTDKRVTTYFDGTVAMLVLRDTSQSDRGMYKCSVSSDAGSAFTSASLDVERKSGFPEIVEKIKDVEAFETGEAKLEVQVTGYPKPSVEWYLGKTKITDSERYRTSLRGDLYTLSIIDLKQSDTGPYKCIATNDHGSTGAVLDLTVKEKLFGPHFSEEEGEWTKTGRQGGFVNISFTLNGNPRPHVVWYKDGILLYDTTRVDIRSRGDLQYVNIFNLTPEDAGTYVCEARSRIGTAFRSCILYVKGKLFDKI